MSFFSTFRGRLLLILLFLLVMTLGVQYYLNLLTERQNQQLREMQERAIVAGFALGFSSLTSRDFRLQDLLAQPGQRFLDEGELRRIKDILVIDSEWRVWDSLSDDYLPTLADDGSTVYKDLADLTDLPPLMEAERFGAEASHFPNASAPRANGQSDEAHAVAIETSEGRWYVMVLLKNDPSAAVKRAAQPLIFTLGILLVSTLVTFYLVWRFTRPIANLSNAAPEVADRKLSVVVTVAVPARTVADTLVMLLPCG